MARCGLFSQVASSACGAMLAQRNPLTPEEIAPYLIESGLISARSMVEGDLVVLEDASLRNSNFKVVRERGASYLISGGRWGARQYHR